MEADTISNVGTNPALVENDISSDKDGSYYSSDCDREDSENDVSGSSSAEESTSPEKSDQSKSQEDIARNERMETHRRLEQMEKTLADLTRALDAGRSKIASSAEADQSWNYCSGIPSTSNSVVSHIRWDHIKPFPNDIPANKMWEEWHRFIENFEIAASLSSANDPVQHSKLLFLSIGEKLQGIVRATGLRPDLREPNCCHTFVEKIGNNLQSMIDTTRGLQ